MVHTLTPTLTYQCEWMRATEVAKKIVSLQCLVGDVT